MIERTPIIRIAGLLIIGLFGLLVFMFFARNLQEPATVLLTWPPLMACIAAFLAAAIAMGLASLAAARPGTEYTVAQASGLLLGIAGSGALGVFALCLVAEATSFEADLTATPEAFPISRVTKYNRTWHRHKTRFHIALDEASSTAEIPVPQSLFEEIGRYSYNERMRMDPISRERYRKCLTLHVQRSYGHARVVLRGADGREFTPMLHDCGEAPQSAFRK